MALTGKPWGGLGKPRPAGTGTTLQGKLPQFWPKAWPKVTERYRPIQMHAAP